MTRQLSKGAEYTLKVARAHDDRFLFISGDRPACAACWELVTAGFAKWLPSDSIYAPGIALTTRGVDHLVREEGQNGLPTETR